VGTGLCIKQLLFNGLNKMVLILLLWLVV